MSIWKFNWRNDWFFTWRPFGLLLGSLLGGKISRSRTAAGFSAVAQGQRMFALSLIVLSAKLSKADGQVSKEELIAVKDKLKIQNMN